MTMRFYKILFLLTIVTFTSCRKDEIFDPIDSDPQLPPPENVDNNLISGIINDDTFNPLSDVTVQLYDGNVLIDEKQTLSDGTFYFIVDEIKDYLVYVSSLEYQDILTSVNPSDINNEVIVSLQLGDGLDVNWDINSYDWISVEGKVLNSDGSPSINTTVLLIDFGGDFINYTTTNSQGYYKSTIPSDKFIYVFVDEVCGTGFNNDIVISDEDIILGDIIIENEIGTITLSGNIVDCDNNPILSGEIIFYGESDILIGIPQSNVLQAADINDGFYEIELDIACSSHIYYEAIDHGTNTLVYGEVYQIADITMENVQICDTLNEGGTVDLNINNLNFTLEDHYAFEYNNYVSVFSFDEYDYVQFEFQTNMVEGTYDIEQLIMRIDEEVYHSSGIELKVTVSSYPEDSRDNIIGHIEGEIYHALTQQKRPFTIDFDIPIF